MQNDRRHPRVAIRVEACLRSASGREEFVTTENASVGGFRFIHKGPFQVGARMEVSVPYVRGGVNIFVPARLAYSEKAKVEGLFAYGVCYISEKNVSSLSGPRPGAR